MLRVTRSVCAEFAAGKIFSRNQRTADGHGAFAEGRVKAPTAWSGAQFAQDKFLEKPVEVYLEKAQVPARSCGRAKVIPQLGFCKVIFCGDDQPRLIECAQPRIGVFGGNAQGAIRQTFFVTV